MSYAIAPVYRPPECWGSCCETWLAVHGIPLDVWSVGILVLNSLTGDWIEKQFSADKSSYTIWEEDVLPLMQIALEESNFRKQVQKAFPAAHVEEDLVKNALNFLHGTLATKPEKRPSVSTLLEHKIWNEFGFVLSPDRVWIPELTESAEQNDRNAPEDDDDFESLSSDSLNEESFDGEDEVLSISSEENVHQGESSSTVDDNTEQESEFEINMDEFEDFVHFRATKPSAPAVTSTRLQIGGGESYVEQEWTAYFEGQTEQKKKKRTLVQRIRGWFRKRKKPKPQNFA